LVHVAVYLTRQATAPAYPLSLHDALPICTAVAASSAAKAWRSRSPRSTLSRRRKKRSDGIQALGAVRLESASAISGSAGLVSPPDRKSTRLNSSHVKISYAVFCLKKKKRG